MQNSRFVILTGHLNDYPLSDLVGILRHQRKTGRLLIEYAKGPAVFFFYEGDLVDARLNDLSGLQAICFALGQPPASFNFNPLIQPSQKTIEDSLQRTVSEMFGCWDESHVQIAAEAINVPLLPEQSSEPDPLPIGRSLPAYEATPLALPPATIASSRRPASFLLMTAAGLATLGVSTAIALSGSFRTTNAGKQDAAMERSTKSSTVVDPQSGGQRTPVAKNAVEGTTRIRPKNDRSSQSQRAEARKDAGSPAKEKNQEPGDAQAAQKSSQPESVTVVMEIENGRVLRASIANPKPGLDSYEALALRIARQRRYSSQQNGQETVKIKVSRPDQ
jgi:hypothetical protein